MKKSITSVISLTVICLVVAVLLALVNSLTAPIIEKTENEEANKALLVVMPNGEGFEKIDFSSYTLPSTITDVYKEKNGGYVFKITTSGYSSGLVIMCGVGNDGKVTGAECIASSETLGEEKNFGKNFDGIGIDEVDFVDTVSGATRTTSAYRAAIKDALNSFIILGGGTVDIRTDEEILRDNLNLALPDANEEFTKWFKAEELDGIKDVYLADNGKGYVFVTEEGIFVGTDQNGNTFSDIGDEVKYSVLSAYKKVISSKITEIDLSEYNGISDKVVKAYRTESGNFIFDLRASGYGINGDYGATGEYIYIKVSATSDGKIISCVTVSQHETPGIGSACGDPSYYTQYDGKTAETYENVDAISSATFTNRGYKTAISKVFETVKILKGESTK